MESAVDCVLELGALGGFEAGGMTRVRAGLGVWLGREGDTIRILSRREDGGRVKQRDMAVYIYRKYY